MTPAFGLRVAVIAVGMLVALASPRPSLAQTEARPPIALTIGGRVAHPRSIALADLQALPAMTVEVAHTTPKGTQKNSFTGALLWTLIDAAAPIDEDGPHSHLQHTMLAKGRDGYAVALAIGELDPGFEGKQVLVAYAQDGKPLAELRLVVTNDAKAGRSVRDLVAIDIR